MQIHQLLAAAHDGDATGDAAMTLAGTLNRRGHDAGVFALTVDRALRGRVRPVSELPEPGPSDTTILHFNVPSPLNETLTGRDGRRVIVYHNLTPPELLLPHCPEVARLTALGRQQLRGLADSGRVDLAVGVSAYNTEDLSETGFTTTATVPLPVDLNRLNLASNPVLAAELASNEMPTFLTVGRVAPNKRVEDFLKTAAYYLRYVSPKARFIIAGSTRGLEPYLDALITLHGKLKLDQRVRFVHHVSLADLVTYYRAAAVYVCTSAHEGFCVPLLEAMALGVPIVARRAAAIPETLGDAGILVDSDDPAEWAEVMHLTASDEELRADLLRRAEQRVAAFDTATVLEGWVEALTREPPT